MKLNERYFYCFGCGVTGDAIDLVARLFDLSNYEAAQKLVQDFGIGPDKPPAAAELLELLKEGDVTITLSEYGGFERVGELPRTLTSNDRNMQTKPGDVMLYQSSSIVFFYGTNRWAYTKLATISDLRADEIKSFFDQDDTAVLSMP